MDWRKPEAHIVVKRLIREFERMDIKMRVDGRPGKLQGDVDYSLEHVCTRKVLGDNGQVKCLKGGETESGNINILCERQKAMWVLLLQSGSSRSSLSTQIVPKPLSNVQFNVSTDFSTRFIIKATGENCHLLLDVNRTPGSEFSIKVDDCRRELMLLTSDFSQSDEIFKSGVEIKINQDLLDNSQNILIDIIGKSTTTLEMRRVEDRYYEIETKILHNKDRTILHVKSRLKLDYSKMEIKYKWVLGQGKIKMRYENKVCTFLFEGQHELKVFFDAQDELIFEGKVSGQTYWTYRVLLTTENDPHKYELKLDNDITLTEHRRRSSFMKFLGLNFDNLRNEVRIILDKQNRILFLPRCLFDVKMFKESQQLLNVNINTKTNPYQILIDAPHIFRNLNIGYKKMYGSVTHEIGRSMLIQSNIGGGIEVEGQRSGNVNGGQDMQLQINRAGVQIMDLHLSYDLHVSNDDVKLIVKDSVELIRDGVIYHGYRRLASHFKFLSLFTHHEGEIEIFINKRDSNDLFPKFYVKADIINDGQLATKALFDTNQVPHRMELYHAKVYPRKTTIATTTTTTTTPTTRSTTSRPLLGNGKLRELDLCINNLTNIHI